MLLHSTREINTHATYSVTSLTNLCRSVFHSHWVVLQFTSFILSVEGLKPQVSSFTVCEASAFRHGLIIIFKLVPVLLHHMIYTKGDSDICLLCNGTYHWTGFIGGINNTFKKGWVYVWIIYTTIITNCVIVNNYVISIVICYLT